MPVVAGRLVLELVEKLEHFSERNVPRLFQG